MASVSSANVIRNFLSFNLFTNQSTFLSSLLYFRKLETEETADIETGMVSCLAVSLTVRFNRSFKGKNAGDLLQDISPHIISSLSRCGFASFTHYKLAQVYTEI